MTLHINHFCTQCGHGDFIEVTPSMAAKVMRSKAKSLTTEQARKAGQAGALKRWGDKKKV